jgi:hypothetical protein
MSRLPGRILGIDAGGSGTRVVVLEGGELTHLPDGPPMNALLTDGFADHLRQRIAQKDSLPCLTSAPGRRRLSGHRCLAGGQDGKMANRLHSWLRRADHRDKCSGR